MFWKALKKTMQTTSMLNEKKYINISGWTWKSLKRYFLKINKRKIKKNWYNYTSDKKVLRNQNKFVVDAQKNFFRFCYWRTACLRVDFPNFIFDLKEYSLVFIKTYTKYGLTYKKLRFSQHIFKVQSKIARTENPSSCRCNIIE